MKKIIITAPREVRIIETKIPSPGSGEILVKTELNGISAGTEMMLFRGTYPNFRLKKWPQWREYPVAPGYETVGRVVEIGPDKHEADESGQLASLGPKSQVLESRARDFAVGDRVMCLGEHGEYAVVPAAFAAKVPENLSSEEATLGALATTAMHCTRRAEIAYGDTVAITGVGVLGFLTIQHMKNAGARRIAALDVADDRLEIAARCGATWTINPKKADPIRELLDRNGLLADIAIEASGVEGTEQLCLDLIRERGRVVLLGWREAETKFLFGDFYFKEASIVVSRATGPEAGLPYAYVRWTSDQSLRWALELLGSGQLSGKFFKPSKFSYREISKVYQLIDRRDAGIGLQSIIYWD